MSTTEKKLYKQVTVKSRNTYESVTDSSPTYKGFSTVGLEGSNPTLYDIALIKQDLINHFHIRQGEKLTDPEFSTIIWDILFEPLTENSKNAIIENVQNIINYDPRVSVNRVVVDSYESGIQIECDLTYLPYSIVETLQFRFDQNAGFLN